MKENQHINQRFTYMEPSVDLLEFQSEETLLCTSGNGTINDFGSENFGEL